MLSKFVGFNVQKPAPKQSPVPLIGASGPKRSLKAEVDEKHLMRKLEAPQGKRRYLAYFGIADNAV